MTTSRESSPTPSEKRANTVNFFGSDGKASAFSAVKQFTRVTLRVFSSTMACSQTNKPITFGICVKVGPSEVGGSLVVHELLTLVILPRRERSRNERRVSTDRVANAGKGKQSGNLLDLAGWNRWGMRPSLPPLACLPCETCITLPTSPSSGWTLILFLAAHVGKTRVRRQSSETTSSTASPARLRYCFPTWSCWPPADYGIRTVTRGKSPLEG